jgi:hypothetical protein
LDGFAGAMPEPCATRFCLEKSGGCEAKFPGKSQAPMTSTISLPQTGTFNCRKVR